MQINLFTGTGRLGRDPEAVHFESGSSVAKFSIAIDKNTSNRDEKPNWIECEVWGQTAEVAANYCKKGSLIAVTGSLFHDFFTDKEGAERAKVRLRVDRLTLLGSKDEDGGTTTNTSEQATDDWEDF